MRVVDQWLTLRVAALSRRGPVSNTTRPKRPAKREWWSRLFASRREGERSQFYHSALFFDEAHSFWSMAAFCIHLLMLSIILYQKEVERTKNDQ